LGCNIDFFDLAAVRLSEDNGLGDTKNVPNSSAHFKLLLGTLDFWNEHECLAGASSTDGTARCELVVISQPHFNDFHIVLLTVRRHLITYSHRLVGEGYQCAD
jgi:hypothetical protein